MKTLTDTFWICLLRETWAEYQRHNAPWLAAALAYFATFAVAPLIIVVVEIAGFVVHNDHQVLDAVFGYMQRDLGSGSQAVRQIVSATFNQPGQSIAAIVAWSIFVFAALGLFGSLQFALNTVWGTTKEQPRLWGAIRQRTLGFAMMLMVAFLLLASVFANAALTAAAVYFAHFFIGLASLMKIADFVLSFAFVWVLFALLYRYLPNRTIAWRDVWIGAAFTALLFTVGQFLLGWYLGRAGVSSAYGAFGSIVAFLLWVYYTSQIFLFGAEFTHVYARHDSSWAARCAFDSTQGGMETAKST